MARLARAGEWRHAVLPGTKQAEFEAHVAGIYKIAQQMFPSRAFGSGGTS